MVANTIDEVIDQLDEIIAWAQKNQSPMGYFPALSRKVSIAVREALRLEQCSDPLRQFLVIGHICTPKYQVYRLYWIY